MPPGWTAEAALGLPELDGYLPAHEAADEMGVTEAELAIMVRTGKLEARDDGVQLFVRPALVSVLGVRDRREG